MTTSEIAPGNGMRLDLKSTISRNAAAACLVVFVISLEPAVAQTNSVDLLRLVPFPKNVRLSDAGLKITRDMIIQVDDVVPANQGALQLRAELAGRMKTAPKVSATA